jgi:hypothetical protein
MSRSRLGTLATLELLRPPEGYHTVAALATTYSADLVACAVSIMTLAGASPDDARNRLPDAILALQRMNGRVLIVAQRGRIGSGESTVRPALALLDQVIREARFDEASASFHPKVWLVRQRPEDKRSGDERYVAIVGSRNLTRTTAWDLGVALIGSPRHKRTTVRLPALQTFARLVTGLVGGSAVARLLGSLADVYWELPRGVESADFGYRAGRRPGRVGDAPLLSLPEGKRVLIVSPFLDRAMVREAAAHWGHVRERRLVAGRLDLGRIAAQARARPPRAGDPLTGYAALRTLNAHSMVTAAEGATAVPKRARQTEAVEDSEPEEVEAVGERGLHAKAVAVLTSAGRATIMVGSPNLTRRAWAGANAEAYLVLDARRQLADELWEWSSRAVPYAPEDDAGPPYKEDDRLERARKRLAVLDFRLSENARVSRLTTKQPLPWNDLKGINLLVARGSTPEAEVVWKPYRKDVQLLNCTSAQRTAFLGMRLRTRREELAWIQMVRVTPPITEHRAAAIVTEAIAKIGISAWLRALLYGPEGSAESDSDGEPPQNPRKGKGAPVTAETPPTLEEVLRQLSRDPNLVTGLDHSLRQITQNLGRDGAALSARDRQLLVDFRSVWRVIRSGFLARK